MNLSLFLFPSVCIYCCECPFQHFITLPHKFGYVVCSYSFNLMFILISLEISLWLLDYLNCVISKCFREFSVIFLLLIFYFDSVVFQEHTLYYFSFLNMLSFILWPRKWSVLEYVPRALEKSPSCCCWAGNSAVSGTLLAGGPVLCVVAGVSSCSTVVDSFQLSWLFSSVFVVSVCSSCCNNEP